MNQALLGGASSAALKTLLQNLQEGKATAVTGLSEGQASFVASKLVCDTGKRVLLLHANDLKAAHAAEDAQQLLFEEKITAGHARAILSISSQEGRQKLTDKLRQEKISVREAESIARLLENKPEPAAAKRAPLPKSYKKVAKELRGLFGTGVRVKSSQGKNKIEIEFKDEEDLQRIFALMSSAE